MKVVSYQLNPPELADIAITIENALQKNFESASVSIVECPDLREKPFYLAAEGLSGNERIADIGGQPNLFPSPVLSARYSLLSIAEQMEMRERSGMLIGAGAGPFFDVGVNCELAPNLKWELKEGASDVAVTNLTHFTSVVKDGSALCQKSPSVNCALMTNLYGSDGLPGPVLKITARKNIGGQCLTDCIRFAIRNHYGVQRPISIGGAFVMRKGTAKFHVMPDFPPEDQMPFKTPKQLNEWLKWYEFDAPMICLTVMHTGDPGEAKGENLDLRMEHTHCFTHDKPHYGGHYHTDIQGEGVDDVEYEGYFNTAKKLFRIDQPSTALDADLHEEEKI